ncbi:unnamed protein product [Tilletia controversa]|uniref:Uncharacterized protein n=1 Tax=Tilletia controversa TaxID=13291 RepID=A0A8X7N1D0_9BASI|nr:hypothetical protein CF328_g349 [Tilletia controversa]KAE8255367.1 hypothetical protein A4X06_0g461 [Tilletia controversa]CAD6928715.1 unnamed protein product [Tilletia controversa]CAD6935253.1 unnamed protein product [Tilletia controversa]CAD6943197.1 unnamed protein product [Tilletia controversa]
MSAADSTTQTEMLPNQTVFRAYPQGVYTFSKPFNRFGIVPIGGRTTILKMRNDPNKNALFVIPSTPADDATKAKVAEIVAANGSSGPGVRFLAAPDFVHSMYLQEWSKAYPDALIVGVDGLQEKNPEVKSWHGIYGRDPPSKTRSYAFEPEIKAAYFPTFANKDVVFFHEPSRTLLTADLIFNFPLKEQYENTPHKRPTSWIPFLNSFSTSMNPYKSIHQSFLWGSGAGNPIPHSTAEEEVDGGKLSKEGGSTEERRQHFAKMASRVAGWDVGRIIMCHGEVIQDATEGDGTAKKAWISAFGKYLNPDGSVKI